MKITKQMPVEHSKRTRKVFAFLPKFFHHGSLNEPLRTMIWLDYYLVEERWSYGGWMRVRETMIDVI